MGNLVVAFVCVYFTLFPYKIFQSKPDSFWFYIDLIKLLHPKFSLEFSGRFKIQWSLNDLRSMKENK